MKNWYKINFILSCILWGLVVVCVVIYILKPNEESNIENENTQVETIEEKAVHYSVAESYATIEFVPFYEISESNRYIVECVVAGESKGESFKGKKLVAQCIMNAMIRNNWDAETVRVQYQYAGWEPELENNNPEIWAEVELAVSEVFDKGNLETYEPILYFYNPDKGYSKFHEEDLTYVLSEGEHKFFKLKGE